METARTQEVSDARAVRSYPHSWHNLAHDLALAAVKPYWNQKSFTPGATMVGSSSTYLED